MLSERITSKSEVGPVDDPPFSNPRLPLPTTPEAMWAAPLQLAAARLVLSADTSWVQREGVSVLTGWNERCAQAFSGVDHEKDRAYAQYIVNVMAEQIPRELALLQMTGATVSAFPGFCAYKLLDEDAVHAIPPMLPFTELLPWVTPHDLENRN